MIYASPEMEHSAALNAAAAICAAMRTAPKTKGVDVIRTCVVTGKDKERLAVRMRGTVRSVRLCVFQARCGRRGRR